jgi:ABC-type Fe3+-siderophore transport system permease subunit
LPDHVEGGQRQLRLSVTRQRWVLFAASALVTAGAAMAIGSFLTWGSCPDYPCGAEFGAEFGFPMGTNQSGVEFGPGIATALFGTVIMILGMEAARIDRRPPMILAFIASIGALLAIALHLFATYAIDDPYVSEPYRALYLTTIAAVVGLLASIRLFQLQRSSRPDGDAKGP